MENLTYLLVLKERGFLDTSLGCATSGLTIPPCPFKVSQCPMATIPEFYHKAVLEGRGLNPIFLVNLDPLLMRNDQNPLRYMKTINDIALPSRLSRQER